MRNNSSKKKKKEIPPNQPENRARHYSKFDQ